MTVALFFVPLLGNASEENRRNAVLATAKIAGACGVLDSLIDFQSKSKLQGGDEFVVRFWATEATRLGLTVGELSSQCDKAIYLYDSLINKNY